MKQKSKQANIKCLVFGHTKYITQYPNLKNGWLSICVNVVKIFLLVFYIFKWERLHDDYIQLCKPKDIWLYIKKKMIKFISKKWLYYFYRLIPNGISLSNRHLLVLNGYKFHVHLKGNWTSIKYWIRYE